MAGWHHGLNGHEFEQTLGDSGEPRSLVCCSPGGHKELDIAWQLNNNNDVQSKCKSSVVIYVARKMKWARSQKVQQAMLGWLNCYLEADGNPLKDP